jgi:hypothetical protein
MDQEEVGKAVPDFDGPWDPDGIATKTESHWGFVWRLTLQRDESRITRTSKRLLLAWPRPVTLWSSEAIGAETKVLNCILRVNASISPSRTMRGAPTGISTSIS